MIQHFEITSWQKFFFICGALFFFTAVACGSFGAHYLKEKISPYASNIFETGVKYQFYHASGLLIIALALSLYPSTFMKLAGIFMIVGIVLFAGSLYALALTDIKLLGVITPIGGLFFLVAWLFFMMGLFS